MILDSHSHLADTYFDGVRDAVLARMKKRRVLTISVGTSVETSRRAVALSADSSLVYACVGIHPNELPKGSVADAMEEIEKIATHERVVAVGECGFDYFRADDPRAAYRAQLPLFEAHLALAVQRSLPLMLHIRPSAGTLDAYEDACSVLASWHARHRTLTGNSHFFAGSIDIARKLFDIGHTISFTGVITFTSAYDEVVQFAPLSHLHVETDAPFVAPAPYRGQQSEPWMVSEVIARVAASKAATLAACETALAENAKRMFGIECSEHLSYAPYTS